MPEDGSMDHKPHKKGLFSKKVAMDSIRKRFRKFWLASQGNSQTTSKMILVTMGTQFNTYSLVFNPS